MKCGGLIALTPDMLLRAERRILDAPLHRGPITPYVDPWPVDGAADGDAMCAARAKRERRRRRNRRNWAREDVSRAWRAWMIARAPIMRGETPDLELVDVAHTQWLLAVEWWRAVR